MEIARLREENAVLHEQDTQAIQMINALRQEVAEQQKELDKWSAAGGAPAGPSPLPGGGAPADDPLPPPFPADAIARVQDSAKLEEEIKILNTQLAEQVQESQAIMQAHEERVKALNNRIRDEERQKAEFEKELFHFDKSYKEKAIN